MSRITPLLLLILASLSFAADAPKLPHLRRQGTATQLIVHGQPFIMLAGELHNSVSTGPDYLREAFPRLRALNLNTVVAAVPWELVEPDEGKFDFSLVDNLLAEARQNDLKLVLLWFGSWKNGTSSYCPAWVKRDTKRFIRGQGSANFNTKDILAPDVEANWTADAAAFAAMLRHLRQADADRHTVIMIQVQNEVGFRPEPRDQSPRATALFNAPVPTELIAHLKKNRDSLIPEFRDHWQKAGFKEAGSWPEIFGAGLQAEEAFSAWYYASYINHIAAAGRKEYDLPMYANAWLRGPNGKPGQYPSGGPVANVMDIWRCAAPSIDLLAPDIYLGTFKEICAEYTQRGNPLLIPEASTDPAAVARAFWAIAEHDAIGFAPFGVDHMPPDHPIAAGYAILRQLLPEIARAHGSNRMIGIYQQDRNAPAQLTLPVGDYRAHVQYLKNTPRDLPAYGLIIQTGPEEFLVAGNGFDVRFSAIAPGPRQTELLSVDLVRFVDGRWFREMSLNGDETGANYRAKLPFITNPYMHPENPRILRVRVYRHD